MDTEKLLEALLITQQLHTLREIQRETEDHPEKWNGHLYASLMEDRLTQRLNDLHITDAPSDTQQFIQSI